MGGWFGEHGPGAPGPGRRRASLRRAGRPLPARAAGARQPAFGVYIRDPHAPIAHATGILVLTLAGSQISAMTGFLGTGALRIFGLPRTLPD